MLTRYSPQHVQSLDNTTVGDCNTGFGSTNGAPLTGSIIDRLAIGRNYRAGVPFVIGIVTGTTFLNKQISIGCKLQHGASSGGGDMADFSTGLIPSNDIWSATGLTTDMKNWSTGSFRIDGPDQVYDMLGSHRFVRLVANIATPGNTTSTAAAAANIYGGVAFGEPDEAPVNTKTFYRDVMTFRGSSATST